MIEISDIFAIDENGILDNSKVNLFFIENKKTKKEPVTVFNLDINSEIIDAIRLVAKNYIKELLDITQEIQEEEKDGKKVK